MSAPQLLKQGVDRLRAAGLDDPLRDARLLMAHALEIPAGRLTLALHDPLPAGAEARFLALIAGREDRRPVSQLLGGREFYGRRFAVSEAVLDPRPETEILVAAALELPFARLLDLGTGSGAILLSLLAERPEAEGLGVDSSATALEVARANAVALGVDKRAELRLSDWFSQVDGEFDLILSNPPYVTEAEYDALDPGVRKYEPRAALTPGGDGLDAYRAIAAGLPSFLRPGGRVLLEIGPAQAASVSGLLVAAGLAEIAVLRDLDGRDRVVSAAKRHQIEETSIKKRDAT